MDFKLSNATAILERTPDLLQAMLRDLPDDWTTPNEGPDTWSPYDIVGHLIWGEKTDWIPRAQIILSPGGDKRFEPFDRFAQFRESKGKSLGSLLDEFGALRKENLHALQKMNLAPADLEKKGVHPVFGEVTLAQLLSAWVVHDLNHIAQISRVMASQYKEASGPWVAFLKILQ
jgi:hypothetical protein